MNLYYAGHQPAASGFGWATCNNNLRRALSELVEDIKIWPDGGTRPDVVFMPLVNHDLESATPARGKVNLGYCFFESELGPKAAENAARYDVVFVGSSWCLERLRERGIENGSLLIQGVDRSIFKPQPARKPDGQFRIFSGGKFEYRKGQDLVIAAFKEFSRRHDDAHLVCSWFNPWPKLFHSMMKSDNIAYLAGSLLVGQFETQEEYFDDMLEANELEQSQFTILPQLSQTDLAREMCNTDVALFPNRCEGGTNLVLMEYACCGRKVIANAATGHRDIAMGIAHEIPATTDAKHWAVQSVEDIVTMLEWAYQFRDEPEHYTMSAYRSEWTWEAAARKIVDTARSFLECPPPKRSRPSMIDLASR